MTAEKLQLIATAKVPARFKARWCRWWNMSKRSREDYNFPASPASDKILRNWIDRAAFWAGVRSLYITFVFLSAIIFVHSVTLIFPIFCYSSRWSA